MGNVALHQTAYCSYHHFNAVGPLARRATITRPVLVLTVSCAIFGGFSWTTNVEESGPLRNRCGRPRLSRSSTHRSTHRRTVIRPLCGPAAPRAGTAAPGSWGLDHDLFAGVWRYGLPHHCLPPPNEGRPPPRRSHARRLPLAARPLPERFHASQIALYGPYRRLYVFR